MTESPSKDGGLIYKPPDTHMAVGPGAGAAGRIVQVTNAGIAIFNKSGAGVVAATDLDAFLTTLGASGLSGSGSGNLGFDPKVIYDQHSGRFFVVILDGKTAAVRSNVQICTSKTSAPSTLTSADWTVETTNALTNISGIDTWFDYPGIGADSTRLVVTGNMFDSGGAYRGAKIRVFNKSSLTDDGAPAGAIFNDILDTASAGTIQPAHVHGATLNGDFYMISRLDGSFYALWQVTGAGGLASLVGGSFSVNAWVAGTPIFVGAPQISDGLNANPTLDSLAPRMMNAVYRNSAGNPDSIWCCHTTDIDANLQTDVIVYQIDPNSGNSATPGVATSPAVLQVAVLLGNSATGWTFMPSIAVNANGAVAVCYTDSDSAKAADMRARTRLATDTPNTFQSPVVIATGAGEYDDFAATNPERWGDYSACVVDPDNDRDFWVAHEVCQTAVSAAGNDARWGTRIAKLDMPVVPVVTSAKDWKNYD